MDEVDLVKNDIIIPSIAVVIKSDQVHSIS